MLFLLVQPTWPVQFALVSYYTMSFLFGAVGQFFMPAQGASIPALVPRDQLTAANALFNLTFTATQLLGFAILGPLLSQALGVDMLFIVTMIAFVISALLTLWLPAMPISHRVVNVVERVSAVRRVWSDIREGLVYIKQDAILTKAIAYLTFATTIFMLIAALAPNFVATVVGLPPGNIGYLVAPAGIGVIVGVVSCRGSRAVSAVMRSSTGRSSWADSRCSCFHSAVRFLSRVLAPMAVPQIWR